jgi:hypothetical protein
MPPTEVYKCIYCSNTCNETHPYFKDWGRFIIHQKTVWICWSCLDHFFHGLLDATKETKTELPKIVKAPTLTDNTEIDRCQTWTYIGHQSAQCVLSADHKGLHEWPSWHREDL